MGILTTTITNYYQKASINDSGSVTDTQSSEALAGAQQAARDWLDDHYGAYHSASYSSSTAYLGFTNSTSTSIGQPIYNNTSHVYTCRWNASRTNTRNILKLSFSSPTDITSTSLGTATLKFTVSNDSQLATGKNFYVYAAASNSSTLTQYKGPNDSVYDNNSKVLVTAQTTGGATYNINITSILRQALTTEQLWIALVMEDDDQHNNVNIKLSNGATIEYTIGYTPVGTPTGVTTNKSIQIPQETVNISWIQPNGGTDTTISGYKIYWRAGGDPTTSTYTGTAIVNGATTLSYSFTVPNSRGTTYYIKVQATCEQGPSWDSSLSSAVTVTVNSLPGVPKVTASASKVAASGGSVTFSNISAGTDTDTSQTLSVYWNSSNTHAGQTLVTGNFSVNLNTTTTYYFWTSDGLEYSSPTEKTITVVSAPTINGDVVMTAVATYTPSNVRPFAYIINGSAQNIQGDEGNLSYTWQIISSSGEESTPTIIAGDASSGVVSNNSVNLSNYDVTNLIGFNTSYLLRLKVTDELGQTVQKDSTDIFYIPEIQTVSGWYNQSGADSNVPGSIDSHFDDVVRIRFNKVMTGVTRTIRYSIYPDMSNAVTFDIQGISWPGVVREIPANDNTFTRGTTYYFRVIITLGQKSVNYNKTYTRAPNRTPTNIQILPQSGSQIKPFTQSLCNISFSNQGMAYDAQNDYDSDSVHTIKLGYPANSPIRYLIMTPNGSYNLQSGTVTNQLKLNSTITTNEWTTLLGQAPNNTYTVRLTVITTNIFGTQFSNDVNVTLNFIEGFINIGTYTTAAFQINTNNGAKNIPNINPYYKLYSNQTLSFSFNARAYASQNVTVRIVDSLGAILVNNEVFQINTANTSSSGDINKSTTYDGSGVFTYVIPFPLDYKDNVTFTAYLTLSNGQFISFTSPSCQYIRTNFSNVDLQISNVIKADVGQYNISYTVSDLGSIGSSPKKDGYSSIKFKLYKLNYQRNTYDLYSAPSEEITIATSGNHTFYGDALVEERTTFKLTAVVVNNFQEIENSIPTGNKTFEFLLDSLSSFIFYDVVPTLSYDKNRLGINTAIPFIGSTDQNDNILLIRPAQVIVNGQTKTRDKIYIGAEGHEGVLTITNDGLIIDCGTW